MENFVSVVVGALLTVACACNPVKEDASAFAAEAGQATVVLGSCGHDLKIGWDNCMVERGAPTFPKLSFIMTNPGEWAVGDCQFGLYKSGAMAQAGLVEVDLSGLRAQAESQGFCLLKVETNEHYPDPNSKVQIHNVYMRGGFFIEMVDPGYYPTPANDLISFCVKVMRTTKGRTKIEGCKP